MSFSDGLEGSTDDDAQVYGERDVAVATHLYKVLKGGLALYCDLLCTFFYYIILDYIILN